MKLLFVAQIRTDSGQPQLDGLLVDRTHGQMLYHLLNHLLKIFTGSVACAGSLISLHPQMCRQGFTAIDFANDAIVRLRDSCRS